MTKQVQLFLSLEDETRWSSILKASIPSIHFLNGNVWPGDPEEMAGIESCNSGLVYLFEGDLKTIPTLNRKTGETKGPVSGCVVQVIRSKLRDGVLLSGRIAAGVADGDGRMKAFVTTVWNSLKEIGKIGVLRPDGQIDRNYLVGMNLQTQLRDGTVKIADRATKLLYEPI